MHTIYTHAGDDELHGVDTNLTPRACTEVRYV